jgi:cephalosporin-C deacetylase-like acetyl esterase
LTSCEVGVVSDAGVEAGGGIVAAVAGVAAAVVVAGVAVVALPSVFEFEVSLVADEQAVPAIAIQTRIMK